MSRDPGSLLGPYEILGPLGEGGMGEVYRARDTRLDRTVAVKVAKEDFGERFRNEALAVAALNHPHIAKLFDVGPDYIVMEYVEGMPLRGPLPVAEALRLAGQVLDALEHAHGQGIVHRDLKPANVLVSRSGVKVLDFGLAQRRASGPASPDSAPTLTEQGTVLGTPQYMAPEQIDGGKADERTDVFAFGLLLYEMLTGQRAFDAKSAAGVMAAILEKEPTPVSERAPGVPQTLEDIVRTCLAKDPADRWQSVRELKHALVWASRPAALPARGGWRAMALVVTVIALVVLAAAVVLLRGRTQPGRPSPIRLKVDVPPNAVISSPAVSPDGQRIAFSMVTPDVPPPHIVVRPLRALDTTPVPGGDRAILPFWSPDGRQLAFWSLAGGLKKVDLSGGAPQLVCTNCRSAHGATWGSTDVIVFSTVGKLFRVSARGGEAEPLGALVAGETGRFWPQFLPDGRRYIYLSLGVRQEDDAIYVGELGSDLRSRLVATPHSAAYSPPGHLLYLKDDTLVAQPFDADRLALTGEPMPILDEEVARVRGTMFGGMAVFSVSANGVLAWLPAPLGTVQQLTWFDRSGHKRGTVGEPAVQLAFGASQDGKSLALCRAQSGSTDRDIWIIDVASGASRRLTFDPHDDCGPLWSPDGKEIAFFSNRRGVREIYRKRADGSGDEERLLPSWDLDFSTEDWSSDGQLMVFNVPRGGVDKDLYVLDLGAGGEARAVPFLATPAVEHQGRLSPNRRWLAYMSNESGIRMQVYVREVTREGKAGPGKWQVSHDVGFNPRWRRDGRELFFEGRGGVVMAVDVKTEGPAFEAGEPKTLGWGRGGADFLVTASADGERFLFDVPVRNPEPIRVLVNWLP